MNDLSRIKRSVRERLAKTTVGSTVLYGYGKTRALPALLSRGATERWNDARDRFGAEPGWEAPLHYQWRAILRRSGDDLPLPANRGGPKILFGTGYGFNGFVTGLHSMLAVALRLRGAQTGFMICDKALPACDWNQHGNMDPDPGEFGPNLPRVLGLSRCRFCTALATDVYGPLRLPVSRMSAHAAHTDPGQLAGLVGETRLDELPGLEYRGVAVGEHGAATTSRLLMRGTIDESSPHQAWLLRREVLGAAVATDLLSALLDDVRPDCVVMQHGIYVTHGVLSDLARQKGIRVVVHEWSDRKNTFIWSQGQTTHRELLEEPSDAWEGLRLDDDDEAQLDDYLDSKRSSGMDWLVHYPSPEEDWKRIAQRFAIPAGARVVSLYTNTMWDGQIVYRGITFPSMLDWILDTIEYARTRPDLTFVIREHPGEVRVWGGSGQRMPEEVARRIPDAPSNVVWIPAEDDASSYTLAAHSEVCVVYGTKLGLELAARGMQVIVVGNAFVRGKGITHDPGSRAEYRAILDRVPGLPGPGGAAVERARRYAFHYYFRRVLEIPLMSITNPTKGTKVDLEFDSIAGLRPGCNEILDTICEGIVEGRPFIRGGASRAVEGAR